MKQEPTKPTGEAKGASKRKTLKDFRQQESNLNKHTPKGMAMLEQSFQEVGYAGPMVAAADGEIIDGSARHETAANVFGPEAEPIIVESDGKRPVVVVRTDIKNAQTKTAKRLAAFANRTGQVNLEWNQDVIAEIEKKDAKFFDGLFLKDELTALLGKVTAPGEFPTVDENLETEHVCPKCGYAFSGGKTVEKEK